MRFIRTNFCLLLRLVPEQWNVPNMPARRWVIGPGLFSMVMTSSRTCGIGPSVGWTGTFVWTRSVGQVGRKILWILR
uniref:Secreted protein n=1 Tax=Globodera pallida TaxID=36090 RepID=A0A183C3A6_GLOPA